MNAKMTRRHLQGLLVLVLLVLSEFGTKPVLALELSEVCTGVLPATGASEETLKFFEYQSLLHVNYRLCQALSINANVTKLLAIFKSIKSHSSAQDECQSRGSDLAKLENPDDRNLLECLMEDPLSRQLWIGLKCDDGATLGCTEASSYKWMDGSSVTYDNWKNNQPDNQNEKCVETTSSGWNNAICTSRYYYSCYKDLQPTTTTTPATPTTTKSTTIPSTTATETDETFQTTAIPTTTTTTTTPTTTRTTTTIATPTTTTSATLPITTNTITTTSLTTATQTTTGTTITPTTINAETTSTNLSSTALGTIPRDTFPPTSTSLYRTQASTISATAETSKPAHTEIQATAGGISVQGGVCCQWDVQSTTKTTVASGETLQQTLGSGGKISVELDSPVGFNVTVQTLRLQISVFSPTKAIDLKVAVQIPVGLALEILPEVSQSNVTVRFGVKVNAAETQRAVAMINDKNGGRFRLESATYRCVFLNESTGEWSSYGMTTLGADEGKVRCKSNHTTIFAVLLSVTGRLVPASAKALTYACGTVSILSLVLTLAVLAAVRKRRGNERSVVQINLAIALLLFHVFNLVHDAALQSRRFCEVTSLALHFTILSSAFWMLVEGTSLLLKTTDRAMKLNSARNSNALRMTFAWGLPVLIVTISAIPGFLLGRYLAPTGAGGYKKCWVDSSPILYASVLFPVGVTLLINLFILIRVGIFVHKMSKKTESFKPIGERGGGGHGDKLDTTHLRAALRATAMLLPIMSVPWLLFLFVDASVAFVYLTIVVNGLQGFFVLLVYCIFSKEVRNSAVAIWNRTAGKSLQIGRKKKFRGASSNGPMSTAVTGSTYVG